MATRQRVRIDKRGTFDQSSWMIPYGNLMTILMIFFLILYAFAYIGGVKYEKTLAQLEVNIVSKTQQKKSEAKVEETEVADKLQQELAGYAKVEINAQRIRILLPSPVLFGTAKADLKPKAIRALKEIAKSIKELPNKIIVEGHTDNIPITRGEYKSNWELSSARAFSVIRCFVEKENIAPEKFTSYGCAEYKPIAPNDTEENRAKNRRIEISIIREKS